MNKIKPIEELDFTDDFMFYQVMKNDEICIGVLERLLKIKIDHIERQELQKEIKPYYQSKGIRLDVDLKDSNRVFDVEMQNKVIDALPRRMRYYQSMLDANALLKGQDYKELNESHIIFICSNDPIGRELPVYTFLETCREDKSLLLNDGTHKYFFNAQAAEKEKDVEIRAFLNYIRTRTASDSFTKRIAAIVEDVKSNEAFRDGYMWESLHYQDIKWEAKKEKAIEAAENLLRMKLGTYEQIAQAEGLTVEQVEQLAKEIAAQNA